MRDIKAPSKPSWAAHRIEGKSQFIYPENRNAALIVNSTIDGGYDNLSPWGAAIATARPYKGNTDSARQLNDVQFNRLWER